MSTFRRIVFACPSDSSIKCYEVEAQRDTSCYPSNDDGPDDCTAYYQGIYFPNGSFLEFDSCDEYSKNVDLCTDIKGNDWKIEFTGRYSNTKN